MTRVLWRSIVGRCIDKKHRWYQHFGAKGVKLDARWKNYDNFIADMGEKQPNKKLLRHDLTKGYTKSNCYWGVEERKTGRRILKDEFAELRGKVSKARIWQLRQTAKGLCQRCNNPPEEGKKLCAEHTKKHSTYAKEKVERENSPFLW